MSNPGTATKRKKMKKDLTPNQIAVIRYLAVEIAQAVDCTEETDYTQQGYRLDIWGYDPIYITPEELEALKQLQAL